jgi:hypothetical protein
MRKTKEKINLECILTDPEKLAYSKQLAENLSKKQRAEDTLKSFNTQKKAEIAGLDAEINLKVDKINSGREYRDVECTIFWDWDRKVKVWTRTDTGDVCKEDIISEHELQEECELQEEEQKKIRPQDE